MIQNKSTAQLLEEIKLELSNNGIVAGMDVTLNGVMEVLSSHMSELYNNQTAIFNVYRLLNAAGNALDNKAAEYGLRRYSTQAVVDDSMTNFKFYLPTGITGADYAIDPLQPLVIPAGVQVSNNDWTFSTTQPAYIYPTMTAAYAPIVSVIRGSTDISAGTMTTSNLVVSSVTNINTSASPQILCTNDRTIIASPTSELDSELRFRCFARINSMNNSNENAILLALREIGVNDARFHRNVFGVGTLGVEIATEYVVISDKIYDIADTVVKRIAPYARVIRPDFLQCQICLALQLKNYQAQASTLAQVVSDLFNYVNGLPLGATLSVSTMRRIVLAISNVSDSKLTAMKIDGRQVALIDQKAAPTEKFIINQDAFQFKV